jgi:hypothetical protein
MTDTFLFEFLSNRLRLNRLVCQENGVPNKRFEVSLSALSRRFKGAEEPMKKYCYWGVLIAWVLWIRTQSPTSDSWNALPGFIAREQCAANIKEKLAVWRQFKDAVISDDSVTFTDNNTTMIYICLSDDEDPRRKPKPLTPSQPLS